MGDGLRTVPISLRRPDAKGALFLPSHPVVFKDGAPAALEYQGRRYSFSHTLSAAGDTRTDTVYVFTAA